MKKNLIKIFAIFLGILCSATVVAQQAEEKPKKANLLKNAEKEKSTPTDAAVAKEITQQKVLSENDLPKAIAPGGEFKPMDTNVPVKNYTRNTPEEKIAPVQHPSPKQQ